MLEAPLTYGTCGCPIYATDINTENFWRLSTFYSARYSAALSFSNAFFCYRSHFSLFSSVLPRFMYFLIILYLYMVPVFTEFPEGLRDSTAFINNRRKKKITELWTSELAASYWNVMLPVWQLRFADNAGRKGVNEISLPYTELNEYGQ